MKVTGIKKITPEEAIKILEKHNIIVNHEQAVKILAFMDDFAKIVIKQYVK